MKIVILLFEGVTALDAVGPYESLQRMADAEISFVAKQIGPISTGDGFLRLHADAAISSIDKADILIIPGGHPLGLVAAISDSEIKNWIRKMDATTRWTCSVCTGSLILGAAGLLAGRKASTHWRAQGELALHGVEYSVARVTVDGKYMTSAGVSAGIDMGLRLCGEIAGRELAEAIELSMQYDPQPPFGTGDAERSATSERVKLIETVLRQ